MATTYNPEVNDQIRELIPNEVLTVSGGNPVLVGLVLLDLFALGVCIGLEPNGFWHGDTKIFWK